MSFSWWCKDQGGADLFKEYEINSQALCLDFDGSPASCADIRRAWISVPYKDKLPEAARDAVASCQELVRQNLAYAMGPAHPDCPACTCRRDIKSFFHFSPETLQRFLDIPLGRVWSAGGGW